MVCYYVVFCYCGYYIIAKIFLADHMASEASFKILFGIFCMCILQEHSHSHLVVSIHYTNLSLIFLYLYFCSRSELDLQPGIEAESVYHVGQVVKCRINSSKPASKRINISFVISPKRLSYSYPFCYYHIIECSYIFKI